MIEQKTRQTEEQEKREVRNACNQFFKSYYTDRDWETILSMVTEQAFCIGLAPDEAAQGKEGFSVFLKKQMNEVPEPIPFHIREFTLSRCGESCWCCFARIELAVHAGGTKVCYNLRLTLTLHREGEQWLFDQIHVSEASEPRPENIPLLSMTESMGGDVMELQREVGELISRLFPGGVLCCHVDEGFSMMVSNHQFLLLTGYATFLEYRQAVGSSYLESIHPDDREIYRSSVRFAMDSNKAAECEYRLHRKDGSYIWVHDICHSAVVENGSPVIISALIDVSDQVRIKQRLQVESELDSLTCIYNRKGARRQIENTLAEGKPWLFCIMDLDHFKRVNDLYGHQQGDRVLRWVADQMRTSFGREGTVCRLGGDEFLLFIPDCTGSGNLERRLNQLSDQYIELIGREYPKSKSVMSMGAIRGDRICSIEQMYERADRNLYQIKHNEICHLLLSELDQV